MGLKITEYCVLDIIYQSQTHPRSTRDGWSDATYRKIAEFLGMGKSGVEGIIKRCIKAGLVENHPTKKGHRRTTKSFYDFAYLSKIKDVNIPNFFETNHVRKTDKQMSEKRTNMSEKRTNHVRKTDNTLYNIKTKKKEEKNTPSQNSENEFLKSVKTELKNLSISPNDSARLSAALIYQTILETDFFKQQWGFFADPDKYAKADPKEVLKTWCGKGNWQDIRNFKLTPCLSGQWVRINHEQNLKSDDRKRNNPTSQKITPGKYGANGVQKLRP